jgi:hypothetical protein
MEHRPAEVDPSFREKVDMNAYAYTDPDFHEKADGSVSDSSDCLSPASLPLLKGRHREEISPPRVELTPPPLKGRHPWVSEELSAPISPHHNDILLGRGGT